MNLISFGALDRATKSASLDDRVRLLCAWLFQLIGTPVRKTQNPV